ncbi:MAG TPA: penicillin-insensitive murein endopeptidase [Polyangiaceae bacterium]|jgi:penicillin-insensitive murein endopeptidase|nr:penicillin-insensitive murein endopeptidase [Polyangiaceae bacterium]
MSVACLGTPSPLVPGFHGSVGLPHFGVQTGSLELPVSGPGFVRFRRLGTANFAQPDFIRGLTALTSKLDAAYPGVRLVLGDLSERRGGKIPRHNSHRNGRDVDLLWFLQNTQGVPLESVGFVHVGADGLAVDSQTGKLYRLDVERQWALVKALLESKDIYVQWLFCSRPVEALLIDYARARGEPNDLVWRAETVMLQPSDSLPHDDHMHLRISCTPDSSIAGCDGGGPYWPWLPPLPVLVLSDRDLQEIGQQDPLVDTNEAEVLTSG